MSTRIPFGVGEWYHCFNRGVDKRIVFNEQRDYDRFMKLMYLCNDASIEAPTRKSISLTEDIFSIESLVPMELLVEIGAYALMNNHVHFILHEVTDRGISRYMQRLFTAYAMYFNEKYQRSGSLFQGTFKSKHLHDDLYLKTAVSYVLLNPIEIHAPEWKQGKGITTEAQVLFLKYPYSSMFEYRRVQRPAGKIISKSLERLYDVKPSVSRLLAESQEYYNTHPKLLS
jgi:putative transposase